MAEYFKNINLSESEVLEENQFESVNKAFSKQSVYYDEYDLSNQILVDMRNQVRTHVLKYLSSKDSLLELNAGTGLDALFFSQYATRVHATELSDGMIHRLRNKIKENNKSNLSFQQCSYLNLNEVVDKDFDYIFSNFGGLNCIPDLKQVVQHFPRLLKKNGFITFVVMPPICPWELLQVVKGNFKYAFRRWKKNGALAHLEGEYFKTYYFSPSQVRKVFGKNYKMVSLQGLGALEPQPSMEKFPKKYPQLYKYLKYLDARVRNYFPFNCWADHFIITFKYLG